MEQKNLKIVSFRMERYRAINLKRMLRNKSLMVSDVFRRFAEKLLTDTERTLDFLDEV